MPTIVKDGAVTFSGFDLVDAEHADISASKVILPLTVYLENAPDLSGCKDVGIWLDAGENVEEIESFVDNLPVIALNFPSFTDGRAYSSANILRRKFCYKGELRAVGDVRRDQLEQMLRCGFDAFMMAEGQDPELFVDAQMPFTYSYQTSIDRPVPLFRQR